MIKNPKKIKMVAIFVFLFAILITGSVIVSAQTEYTPLTPLPYAAPEGSTTDPVTYITGMIKLLIGIAGVLAIIMIMVGGVQYITSGDSQSQTEDAKDKITKALMGLILAIASWLILNTINPDLLDINFNVEPANLSNPGGPPPPENAACYPSPVACQNQHNTYADLGSLPGVGHPCPNQFTSCEEYSGGQYCFICQ